MGLPSNEILIRYQEYISNATGAGRAPWAQSPGPFHNFPLLPSPPTTTCHLGQLTIVGIQQLLTMGTLLGKAYSEKFGWNVNFNNTNRFTGALLLIQFKFIYLNTLFKR